MEEYLRVTAPFEAVVTERNVHPGALVGPSGGGAVSTPMLRLVNSRRLRLVVPVPEGYVSGITNGVPITFTVQAYPGEAFMGTVARVAHQVDPKNRTMAVELEVANPDDRLAPGTFCEVRWPVHRPRPSLLVPSGSVASTTGRTFVIRVRDGKTDWVDVKTGLSAGPLVEVFGDLRPGDDIAARGTDEIEPGVQVRTTPVAPAS
jgi:RND family efflux transporter MFP subunit